MACFSEDEDSDSTDFGFRPSLPYIPEPSDEEVTEIIQKVSTENGIQPFRLPKEPGSHPPEVSNTSKRYFETKALGWFCCPKKHHRWSSAHAWCYIDLKKQTICYRDVQKCRKDDCDTPVAPEFSETQIERMAEYATSQFFMRISRKRKGGRGRGRGRWRGLSETVSGVNEMPHDQRRCGKCNRLGRKCWEKFWGQECLCNCLVCNGGYFSANYCVKPFLCFYMQLSFETSHAHTFVTQCRYKHYKCNDLVVCIYNVWM